jgi:exosortase/archaeosortase family protein
MKKKKKEKAGKKLLLGLALRYSLAILLGFFIFAFYSIFTPVTMFLLKLFMKDASISGNLICKNGITIEIIGACVGGSAYYLLLVLNLLTPNIKARKRVLMFLFGAALFFIFNFIRLFLLLTLAFKGIDVYFYHKALWYIGSTAFVFLIWLLCIWIFKIKEIPFVSDVKSLLNRS